MRRREFIASGMALCAPKARAQQPERVPRIGYISAHIQNDSDGQERIAAFRQGLAQRGWLEGRNIIVDFRAALAGSEQVEIYAKELVQLQPDVIVSVTQSVTTSVLRQKSNIPIVFVNVSDPIGAGFVASLTHPGGTLTGPLL